MDAKFGIIGSGFAAAALVLHLHQLGQPLADIIVIGDGDLGAGQAYGAAVDAFRLNVRADLQRLWADDPDHFDHWAARHINDPDGANPVGHFYRRHDFATYLRAQLAALPDDSDLRQIRTRATAVTETDGQWHVQCDGHDDVTVAHVVLATGNPDPQWPVPEVPQDPRLITVPWDGQWLADIRPDARVVIVGAGLTAMDAIHALHRDGHAGPISVITPRGMVPPVQTGWSPQPGYAWPEGTDSAVKFLREMRRHLGPDSWHSQAWQERFEQLRVGINAVWAGLPARDRNMLMRRLGWLWSLLRFRAGPHTIASLATLEASGQLHRHTGRLASIAAAGPEWECVVARHTPHREAQADIVIAADYVVNCTGMGRDQLVQSMLQSGLIARSQAANAPLVRADMRLVAPDGTRHETLFMIGPATGHDLGDVVGSASIARQAASIAGLVTSVDAD